MKRVCFLLTSLESGGAENYTLRFLQYVQNKIEPVIICKNGKTGILEPQFKAANAQIVTLPQGFLKPKAWWNAFIFFKTNKIDSVCDFTGNFSGIYLLLAKLAGIRTRIAFYRRSSHAFNLTQINLLFDTISNRLVQLYATKILANSFHGLSFFHPGRNQSDKRYKVVPNGLDLQVYNSEIDKKSLKKELGIPQDAFVIGHTGRLNIAKNHVSMIKVAEVLVEAHEDIYFLFCGKDTDKLASQSISDKLKKRLILLGYRDDIHRILKALDLYIFPSITEGQPNALIEAMVSGLPFLASDIAPIKEIVPEELYGNLFSPLETSTFRRKIEEVYKNRVLLDGMCIKDEAKEMFSAKKNFNQLLQLL